MKEKHELVLVIDFGAQYAQLIARRVREFSVYCEIIPYTCSIEKIKEMQPAAIILSGGPASVYVENAPKADAGIFALGVPVLGICYGHQFMCQALGGRVSSANIREYGKTVIELETDSPLFHNLIGSNICWMSHTDFVAEPPADFEVLAVTGDCPVAAVGNAEKKFYGVQFHPEVEHTPFGKRMIGNFLFDICRLKGDQSKGRRQKSTVRSQRRRGFFRGRGAGAQSCGQTAHLYFCRPRSVA